jgi:hypothetical protein
MLTVSRRGFLAAGSSGAAALALAACGDDPDPRAEVRDTELVTTALGAEGNLQAAYSALDPGPDGAVAVKAFIKASAARQSALAKLGASGPPPPKAPSGSDPQGFESTDTAANAAIAAYREAAGISSATEARATTAAYLAAVASELATVRGFAGTDQSPEPFVTGLAAKPLVTTDATTSSTTSSSTTTSSTSTATTP